VRVCLYAVYNHNNKLLVVLVVLFAAQALSLTLTFFDFGNPQHSISLRLPNALIPLNRLDDCFGVSSLPTFLLWIPPLFFEIILCLLMVYKAWSVFTGDWSSSLLLLLIRDRYVLY
jgi:hypothetical protein